MGRPALPRERPTIFCRHTRGRCGAWGLRSLCCFAPGDWTDPPKGSACSPHQPQGAAPGPLPGPPAPPPPTLGATPGQHALRATRSRHPEGSERWPGLTLERGAPESALVGHVSLSSLRAATPPSRPSPAPGVWSGRALGRQPGPAPSSLLTAPAWALSLSLLCVFLGLSLLPGMGCISSGACWPFPLLLWGLASSLPSSRDTPPSTCCSFCYQCSPFSLR